MKARTSLLLICLAATSVTTGWAQTVVRDRAGTQWTCRADDEIHTHLGPQNHKFDIKAAQDAGEKGSGNDHHPICIDALHHEQIIWSLKGATKIKAHFAALTTGNCPNKPFLKDPDADSGNDEFLLSGMADDERSGCAYEVKFTSSIIGVHDPHIIINGSNNASLEELKDTLEHLKAQVKKLESELKYREEKKK
jgi:hypothetical protein